MIKTRKERIEETAGVGCQIAFEYEGWGEEHISDMYNTYKECGEKPPCDIDTLAEATSKAQSYKNNGYEDYEKCQKRVEQYLTEDFDFGE